MPYFRDNPFLIRFTLKNQQVLNKIQKISSCHPCFLKKSIYSFLGLVLSICLSSAVQAEPRYALSQYGEPLYPETFTALNYVNPNAPKGGVLRMAALGRAFDSFNPFISKGAAPEGMNILGSGPVFESLFDRAADDPFTIYGLVAEKMELNEDKTQMTFYLHPDAKFYDGSPITAEDVAFSYQILIDKGNPIYKLYFKGVSKVEVLNEKTIRYHFEGNPELPYIIGQHPILSKKDWEQHDFTQPSLDHIPLSSGPYTIKNFEAGRFIEYQRNPNYWAEDLPMRRGQNNFDVIRYELYFDANAAFEAFKAGKLDIRLEQSAARWSQAYDFSALQKNWVLKQRFPHKRITSMQGFVLNLRKEEFKDIQVRKALGLAMNIPWSIKIYSAGLYQPTHSFFGNSVLEAKGRAEGDERILLQALQKSLPEAHDFLDVLLTQPVTNPPLPKNVEELNHNLILADTLLSQAGFTWQNGKRLKPNQEPFVLDIMLPDGGFDRWAFPWCNNLKRLGIECQIQTINGAQYQTRLKKWQYDITLGLWPASESPGNELTYYFSSSSADQNDTQNYMGLKNPVVDEIINLIIDSRTRDEVITRTRALDRTLRNLYFVLPHFNATSDGLVYWNKFSHPTWQPTNRVAISAFLNEWWIDTEKEASLQQAMDNNQTINMN